MKLFTVDEANAMIPELVPILEELRAAQAVLAEEHDFIEKHARTNGGGAEGKEFLEAMTAAGRAIGSLTEAGLVVRDPASGLVDFPSERDGEQVFLCWRLGESEVGWWHPTTSGFADRRPL